jgi:hypothetical protein
VIRVDGLALAIVVDGIQYRATSVVLIPKSDSLRAGEIALVYKEEPHGE